MLTIPGKIPIRIHPLFWLVAGLLAFLSMPTLLTKALMILVIFFSVLIHEFGHALTATYFGQEAEINLVPLGGLTHRRGKQLKLWQEFFIVLNGPLAGFFLFGCSTLILNRMEQASGVLGIILVLTQVINLYWTIINLLPVQPLDGGKLLSIVLEGLFGIKGLKLSLFLSILFSLAVSGFFFYYGQYLIGAFFLLFTFESFQIWKQSLPLTSSDRNEDLKALLSDAQNDLKRGAHDEAWEKLSEVRHLAEKGVVFVAATELMAVQLTAEQRYHEAYELLAPIKKQLDPEHVHLLHQLAYRNKDWKTAIELGNWIYRTYPGYDTALINAYCYSMMEDKKAALNWLECAIHDGLPNVQVVLQRPEFDPIRSEPKFQKFYEN